MDGAHPENVPENLVVFRLYLPLKEKIVVCVPLNQDLLSASLCFATEHEGFTVID